MGVEGGAEGIGLVRTEFLYLGRDDAPTEDEQHDALVEMVRAMNGLPTIVRTLDIGGDKNAPYLDLPAEDNSFLGIRGIRLCLQRPELFLPQLRAIYRASSRGAAVDHVPDDLAPRGPRRRRSSSPSRPGPRSAPTPSTSGS